MLRSCLLVSKLSDKTPSKESDNESEGQEVWIRFVMMMSGTSTTEGVGIRHLQRCGVVSTGPWGNGRYQVEIRDREDTVVRRRSSDDWLRRRSEWDPQ